MCTCIMMYCCLGANLVCQNQEGELPLVLAEYGGHEEVSVLKLSFHYYPLILNDR